MSGRGWLGEDARSRERGGWSCERELADGTECDACAIDGKGL